jgi:site-specific recombinase XerD
LLNNYLAIQPRNANEFLFSTVVKNRQLATGDIRKIVRLLAAKSNTEHRVWPHLLRHALGTHLLNKGASLIMIQNQLGHAFIESTMIYVHSMPKRVRAEYDLYKPAYI